MLALMAAEEPAISKPFSSAGSKPTSTNGNILRSVGSLVKSAATVQQAISLAMRVAMLAMMPLGSVMRSVTASESMPP